MSIFEAICIFLAGIAAGTINTVVGSGTLVTFPTLLAFGYPPVVATMSNAVGLVPGNISGTWGYRRELRGQWDRLRWQLPGSLLGALTGAWLLLHLPETTFKKVVPVLLVIALILVIAQPRIQAWTRRRADKAGHAHDYVTRTRMVLLVISTYLAGVYGGYFAAANQPATRSAARTLGMATRSGLPRSRQFHVLPPTERTGRRPRKPRRSGQSRLPAVPSDRRVPEPRTPGPRTIRGVGREHRRRTGTAPRGPIPALPGIDPQHRKGRKTPQLADQGH